MNFKKTYGTSCEHDDCASINTYYIKINGVGNWLCKTHMIELIENLKFKLEEISQGIN